MKEQFYTTDNVLNKSNVEQVIVKGVKSASPVIPVTANTDDPEGVRYQFGNTFYDVDGILGAAGLYYAFYIAAGLKIQDDWQSGLNWSTRYKASDDLGLTWTAGSGVLHATLPGLVVINPDSASPVQAYFRYDEMKMRYADRADLADMSGDIVAVDTYDNVDFSSLTYLNGKYIAINQQFFNRDSDAPYSPPVDSVTPVWNPGDTDKYQRIARYDIAADASTEVSWAFGTASVFMPTTKTVAGGKNDHTNADANITPQNEPHLGAALTFNTDINGDDQYVVGQSFQDRTTETGWHSGNITPGLTVISDIVNDSIFTRVRSDDDADSVLVDRGGTWDSGLIWMFGSLTEVGDSLIGLYSGFSVLHEELYENAVEPYAAQVGRAVWRKDGLTAIKNTDGLNGDFSTDTITKPTQSRFRINYDGVVGVELLDVDTDSVLSGYSVDDCDLTVNDTVDNFVTWDGKQALNLPSVKVKFYLEDGATVTSLYSLSVEQDTYDADVYVPCILDGSTDTIYKAYSGKVFSRDGVNYYRGANDGVCTTATPVGLTGYAT